LIQSASMFEGLRGDIAPARARLLELEARIADESTSPQDIAELRVVESWLELADGSCEEAHDRALRASRSDPGGWSEIQGLVHACRAALWLGDLHRARSAFDALERTRKHGAWLECARDTLRAGILALDGDVKQAIATYFGVAGRWRNLGVPFDLALAHLDMATLVGPEHAEALEAAEEAREILTRLGAKPFLERLDAALAERAAPRAQG
jgi:ATP/maltotriose-dependent transcriptional regulator MalT